MRLLLIEDDMDLCDIMVDQLKRCKIAVDVCNHGEVAAYYIRQQSYDVIVLDRMLPGKDGIEIMKDIRGSKVTTPVIMVTAMDTIQNRIEGLDMGADDYLVKPFAMEELLARIRALIRRPTQMIHSEVLEFSDMKLYVKDNRLEVKDNSCKMSKRETDLLAFFIRNKEQTLTREILLTRVWGADNFVMDSNLDNFICFLRKRMKTVESRAIIRTVRCVGYRLEEENARSAT